MAQADDVGAYAKSMMQSLARKHEIIGDVRGKGLFFGAEFVTDRTTKAPATDYILRVIEELKNRGILLNKIGVHYNTLKIRPNLQFTRANADQLIETLDNVLTDVQL